MLKANAWIEENLFLEWYFRQYRWYDNNKWPFCSSYGISR